MLSQSPKGPPHAVQECTIAKTFPMCVKAAWDYALALAAHESTELSLWSGEDSQSWSLPLYPQLGDLDGYTQTWAQELSSVPCGFLQDFCPVHRAREISSFASGLGSPTDESPRRHGCSVPEGPPEAPAASHAPDDTGPDRQGRLLSALDAEDSEDNGGPLQSALPLASAEASPLQAGLPPPSQASTPTSPPPPSLLPPRSPQLGHCLPAAGSASLVCTTANKPC